MSEMRRLSEATTRHVKLGARALLDPRVSPVTVLGGGFLEGVALGIQLALVDPDLARSISDAMAASAADDFVAELAADVESVRSGS